MPELFYVGMASNLAATFAVPLGIFLAGRAEITLAFIAAAALFLPLFVFLPKLIQHGMKADTEAAINAFGKNEQVKKVFWTLFVAMAGLVLAKVLDPVSVQQIIGIISSSGMCDWDQISGVGSGIRGKEENGAQSSHSPRSRILPRFHFPVPIITTFILSPLRHDTMPDSQDLFTQATELVELGRLDEALAIFQALLKTDSILTLNSQMRGSIRVWHLSISEKIPKHSARSTKSSS
ncbi:MAG: hypothetical protein NTZ37_04910 [Methanoregula sp.]|nr:hypothetical protein [Methanoregula sp.]